MSRFGALIFAGTLVIAAPLGSVTNASAAPAATVDSKVNPHYFGPWPNWANSPLTMSKAAVAVAGAGTGATAVAQVDPATGGIASIQVTDPGHDYTAGTTVTISGGTTDATATAVVAASGAVIGFMSVTAGAGYTSFDVGLAGGGGSGATAIASGGVDAVTVTDGGKGYTMPTVDFDLPDSPDGVQAKAHVPMIANGDSVDGMDANGTITEVVVDQPGSGYTTAPAASIRNGTQFDPINLPADGSVATVTTTLALSAVNVLELGTGFTGAPTVSITDPTGTGTGAAATAVTDVGAITDITLDTPGAGYLTKGMKKFIDELPLTCTPPACPSDPTTKFIPNAVPAHKSYTDSTGQPIEADEYVIGLVQYRTQFSSDLPDGTLVRGYVQLETADNAGMSQHFALTNELQDGTKVPVVGGYLGVTSPQFLGPFINAAKNKPVRIVFRNLLPTGAGGDLFLPTDSTMMGSGMTPMTMGAPMNDSSVLDEVRNPMCSQAPKPASCFKDNRATLHLHGGVTPWISDGTPHQWITPANESTSWPQGVSVQNVPDMLDAPGVVTCDAKDDGCQTFFYTNQQSARLMWYHDHAWGITRLNVYAGEVSGYTITDDIEKKLVADGVIPAAADTLPLIVQDKTFVPSDAQLKDTLDGEGNITNYGQDPTWDSARWGKPGDLWYHHVYMPAQNPGDPSGMSAYGRWMYGSWFWPPATTTTYGPIPNPYYNPSCKLDIPSTWTYQTDPFCEPEQIPGTPNISAGMEQFNDTPLVNGVAYPKVTLDPKSYRLRILNGSNDRFFNLQWYVADPTQGNGKTEVALKPAELAAAQTDPNVSPTPVDANNNAAGPDWVQIANEGGFLPAPAVIDGQQPTTWITDPTRFDVGNVDKHSMLLAPAERSDSVVDFSKFAGKTLILYNDAPAAFPARVASYDYYTGAPDLSPNGAPGVLPGYGPNTRTVMQVTIADTTPAAAFDLTKLRNAFKHNSSGTGVFEAGQHPVIVGQAAYNSAYGTTFAASSNCNAGSTRTSCDGLVRVNDTGTFAFNTLRAPTTKTTMALEPKALHDEMNASTFDEYGRMTANIGVEAQPPTPGGQNITLYPYVNPPTELIDATKLPQNDVAYDTNGLPVSDVKVTPMSDSLDGTQIWRFTHNGVDTHPIHFHLYDVQVLNRVTWDNIIIPPDANELGWKDTVRMSPLEDTIVALRPVIPEVPFEVPNSIRMLDPMDAAGPNAMFNNIDPQGNPTTAITNKLVNFGWEYVMHCHMLSHEEMDMMRPVAVAVPPRQADGVVLSVTGTGSNARIKVAWNDNSINETSFVIQRTSDGTTWIDAGSVVSPLNQPNLHGARTFIDPTANPSASYLYRVVAVNTVGYGAEFPEMAVQSISPTAGINRPAAPTSLAATIQAGPKVSLTWRDNATGETGFLIQRSADGGTSFTQAGTAPARNGTGNVTWVDSAVSVGATYRYRVVATSAAGDSNASNTVTVALVLPGNPTITSATAVRQGNGERVTVRWADVANETGYTIQWSSTAAFTTVAGSGTANANATTFTSGTTTRQTWYFRMRATNLIGASAWSPVRTVTPAP